MEYILTNKRPSITIIVLNTLRLDEFERLKRYDSVFRAGRRADEPAG